MTVALALSPHLDDAAFSAGATLAALTRTGWRVLVATLFTGNVPRPTGFALECQTSKGIPSEVDYMALRRAEDREAMAALGAEAIHLPLLEAPHRGYDSPAALFTPPRPDDPVGRQVKWAVADLLDTHRPDLVLAPQSIGAHVDHIHVTNAARACPGPVWFWRDWPYTIRAPERRPFAAVMAALPETGHPATPADLAAKARAAHAYRSQLPFQFGGPQTLDAALAASGPELFRVSA